MLAWLLGVDLKQVEMIIGLGFLIIIALLIFIAVEAIRIEKEEHDRLK